MTEIFDNGRLRLEQCVSEIESIIISTSESIRKYDEQLSELTVLYEEKDAQLREDAKRAAENKRAESESQLGKLRQMREAVLKHVRIISSHTSSRPNPSTTQPIEPDLTYLTDLS